MYYNLRKPNANKNTRNDPGPLKVIEKIRENKQKDNKSVSHPSIPRMSLPAVVKQDRRQWMEEQEEKNKDPHKGYWLWDHKKVQKFVLEDLKRDGVDDADMEYAAWLALRLKFLHDPFLSFIKAYFRTGQREYLERLGSHYVYEWMRMSGASYINGILYGDEKEWFDDEIIPEYKRGFVSSKHLYFLIPTEDGTDIREMTIEEKYIFAHKESLSPEEYRKIERMKRDDFKNMFPDLLEKLEREDEAYYNKLYEEKFQPASETDTSSSKWYGIIIRKEEKTTYTVFPASMLYQMTQIMQKLGVNDFQVLRHSEIPDGEECIYEEEDRFYAYGMVRCLKSNLNKEDIRIIIETRDRINTDTTEFMLE